jgi:hypothetical protein
LINKNDYFNVEDFNENFSRIESALAALSKRVDDFKSLEMVTGIVTANGTVTLGWRPRWVFVTPSTFDGNAAGTTPWQIFRCYAAATAAREAAGHSGAATFRLRIDELGFTTVSMAGSISQMQPTNAANISAAVPLIYIAFR